LSAYASYSSLAGAGHPLPFLDLANQREKRANPALRAVILRFLGGGTSVLHIGDHRFVRTP
jgi:hypothetical protein